MACTKALRLPRWNGLACRDQKLDASSDVFHLADDERTSTRVLHYSYGANSMLGRVEKSRWGLTMHASVTSANPHKYYLYGCG
jgi:hypothetical protein